MIANRLDEAVVTVVVDDFKTYCRRRWRRWTALGCGAFALLLALSLLFFPQTYSTRMSLNFTSSSMSGGGLLASFAGFSSSPATRYIGVLRSRTLAEEVVQQTGLAQKVGFATEKQAISALMDGLTVNENARDGLLYVTVSLPGPTRLASGRSEKIARLKIAAADAANAYAVRLQAYIATSDSDGGATLLRGAEERIQQARNNYDAAVSEMTDFVRRQGTGVPTLPVNTISASNGGGGSGNSTASGNGAGNGTDLQAAAGELQTLYTARATLEADIQSADSAARMGEQLQARQLASLPQLPVEDPLLTQARNAVFAARSELENQQMLLGPDHPRILVAQDRLKLAETKLNQQAKAVAQGITSQNVDTQVRLNAMRSKYKSILHQIALAERKTKFGREFSAEFERRRNEVTLRLEVLKATLAQAATLSLQVVSAQNRMRVIDPAQPALSSSPGPIKLSILCGFLTIALMAGWGYLEYQVKGRNVRQSPSPISVAA